MEHLQKEITNIYSCLKDDTSRTIYANRLLYSLTGDEKYLKNVIWEIPGIILKMNPDYRLYLRHYSIAAAETVVYAI